MASQDSTSGQVRTPSVDPGTGHARDFEAQVIAQAVQDPAFRARLLADPKTVFADLGLNIPPGVQIQAVQETAEQYYLVLPAAGLTGGGAATSLSDAELEHVAGGGVATENLSWTGCASGQAGCNDPGTYACD